MRGGGKLTIKIQLHLYCSHLWCVHQEPKSVQNAFPFKIQFVRNTWECYRSSHLLSKHQMSILVFQLPWLFLMETYVLDTYSTWYQQSVSCDPGSGWLIINSQPCFSPFLLTCAKNGFQVGERKKTVKDERECQSAKINRWIKTNADVSLVTMPVLCFHLLLQVFLHLTLPES